MSVLSLEMKKQILFTAAFLLSLYSAHGRDKKGVMVSKYGRRDLTLDDKLGTTPAFSIHDVRSLPICAAICEQDDSCTSFFYNKMSRQCQGHDRSLDYTEHFEKCEGTKYYRMYEKSDVKPAGKRLSVFSGRNIPDGVLTELHYVPSAAECLKECGVKPRCVSVYYNQRDRETCKMYLHVYLSGLQAYLVWPGSEFYRHNKSYCAEDPNYVNYPAVNTCFKLYQISRSWGEAKLKCQTRNEQLIAVDTEEVENFVENTILNSGYSYMHYHIGIRRNDGGQYVSVNGDPILYSDWKDGKPQGDDNRRCVSILCTSYKCSWEAVSCDAVYTQYICEKKF